VLVVSLAGGALWVIKPGIPRLSLSDLDAAKLIDEVCKGKDRAASWAGLESDLSDDNQALREVIGRQLLSVVPEGVKVKDIAPYRLSKTEKRAALIGVASLLLLVLAISRRPVSPIEALLKTIKEVQASDPNLPENVKEALANLVEQASDPIAAKKDLLGALSDTKQAIDHAKKKEAGGAEQKDKQEAETEPAAAEQARERS
jgi:hypothetical protein